MDYDNEGMNTVLLPCYLFYKWLLPAQIWDGKSINQWNSALLFKDTMNI